MTDTDLTEVAARMAEAARAATLAHFRAPGLSADNKAAGAAFDPVTVADRASEAAMRAVLATDRPDDAILGEEEARKEGTTGLTWVLDPIDGTRAFISGLPSWGVLIALDDGTRGRIGMIDQPYIGERFCGITGPDPEAWLERGGTRMPIRTRRCGGLEQATLMTTDPTLFTPEDEDKFRAVRDRVRLTRYGMDCYAYAMLALGQIDLVIESGLQAYDIAAPAALVQAAGGVVTDWQGGDCRWGGHAVAAGDPALHRAALELLNSTA